MCSTLGQATTRWLAEMVTTAYTAIPVLTCSSVRKATTPSTALGTGKEMLSSAGRATLTGLTSIGSTASRTIAKMCSCLSAPRSQPPRGGEGTALYLRPTYSKNCAHHRLDNALVSHTPPPSRRDAL